MSAEPDADAVAVVMHATRAAPSSSSSSDEVRVSSVHRASYFIDIGLRLFTTHPLIVITGVGHSIQLAIEVGQQLVALGFCTIARVQTNSLPRSAHGGGGTPKAEFRMELKRIRMPIDISASQPLTRQQRQLAEVVERERPPTTGGAVDDLEEE
jgi:hypothetical protein